MPAVPPNTHYHHLGGNFKGISGASVGGGNGYSRSGVNRPPLGPWGGGWVPEAPQIMHFHLLPLGFGAELNAGKGPGAHLFLLKSVVKINENACVGVLLGPKHSHGPRAVCYKIVVQNWGRKVSFLRRLTWHHTHECAQLLFGARRIGCRCWGSRPQLQETLR